MILSVLSLSLYLSLVSSDLTSVFNFYSPNQIPKYPNQFSEVSPENQEDDEPLPPFFSALSITKQDIKNFENFLGQIERVQNRKFIKSHQSNKTPTSTQPLGIKKRHLSESELDIYGNPKKIYCGLGRMYMANRLMDKCVGKHCSISILQCGNNDTYLYNSTFTGDLKNCTVKQLVCIEPPNYNDTILVDLQGECYLHSVKKNGVEVNFTTTVENWKIFQYQVQVLCGTTVYGWEAFGYNCKSDELFCDGKKVDYPDREEVNSGCEIRSKGCSTFGHNSSDICHEITTVCTNSPTAQVCNQQIQDHRIKCYQNHTNHCVPDMIVCGGTVYNASTYTGSIALCENIQSVWCDYVGQVVFPGQDGYCRIVELACNGTIITLTNQPVIPPHCSISKVICYNFQDCKTHQLGCVGDTGCHYVDKEIPCNQECTQLGPVPACLCPVDYTGEFCQSLRTLECNMTIVAPKYNCESSRLNAPQVCLQFDKKDILSLTYSLSCGFKDYNFNVVQNDGFTYGFIGDQFALSENPDEYYIAMKIFNFDIFSDNKQTTVITLNSDYFLERKFLLFEVDLKDVDPVKYMSGNMMYLEFRLKSKLDIRPTLHKGVLGREYIEITGLPPIQTSRKINYKLIIFGIVTGITIVSVVVYFVYRRIRKNKKLKMKQN